MLNDNKRITYGLSLLIIAIVLLLTIYLVPNSKPEEDTLVTTLNSPEDQTMTPILVRGDISYPPFESINDQGEPEGFNIDIINRIAEIMNLNIELELDSWAKITEELKDGEIDLLIGMYQSEQREQFYDFSIPHYVSSYGIFTRSYINIEDIDDFSNMDILVQEKDIGHEFLLNQNLGNSIITKENWEDLLPALINKEADCVVLSMTQGLREIQEKRYNNIKVITQPLFRKDYSMAVTEGNDQLRTTINEGLSILKSSGEFDTIYKKWFGIYDTTSSNNSLKILAVIITFLLTVLAIVLIWTGTLKKQIKQKTSDLTNELDKKQKIQNQLEDTLEELSMANQAKTQFLAKVSHELRTPLHGIMGITELLSKSILDNFQKDQVTMIQNSSQHLHRILSDLIDISSINSGKFNLNPLSFNLIEIQKWLFPILDKKAKEKELVLTFAIDPKNCRIYADKERISQIIVNLATNSIKYTESGSIHIHLYCKDNNLTITVKDTGCGIPQEKQDLIFEPFNQLHKSKDGTYSGLGLGLSIVKSLVEMLKGSLELKSIPSSGTTFKVSFPIKVENDLTLSKVLPKNKEIPPFLQIPSGNERSVLIAEDEAINRLYLKQLLRDSQWKILEARNGLEALNLVKTRDIDLILMDISMPELNGFEASIQINQYLKEQDKRRIPIIALTAHQSREIIDKCLDCGMKGYLDKPFQETQLANEIKRMLTTYENVGNKDYLL